MTDDTACKGVHGVRADNVIRCDVLYVLCLVDHLDGRGLCDGRVGGSGGRIVGPQVPVVGAHHLTTHNNTRSVCSPQDKFGDIQCYDDVSTHPGLEGSLVISLLTIQVTYCFITNTILQCVDLL